MQLVFGGDAILNITHIADWEHICQQKQECINKNNECENKNQRNHQYYSADNHILLKVEKLRNMN